mmetsp:Transcript_19452/g.15999  ORF Transcript_19452/g.15999 Transcript_19452/m.15999 type:complete len:156 (-) Transcript_19452:97-564(-)
MKQRLLERPDSLVPAEVINPNAGFTQSTEHEIFTQSARDNGNCGLSSVAETTDIPGDHTKQVVNVIQTENLTSKIGSIDPDASIICNEQQTTGNNKASVNPPITIDPLSLPFRWLNGNAGGITRVTDTNSGTRAQRDPSPTNNHFEETLTSTLNE